MDRNQLAAGAASTSRTARRAAFALASLLIASALVWWSRGGAERPAVAAQPVASGDVARAPLEARSAPLAGARAPEVPDSGLPAPRPAAHELGALAATPNELAHERANVNLLVLGLEPGQRASVEALVFDGEGQTRAHALHETDEQGRLALVLPTGRLRLSAWTPTQVAPSVRATLTAEPASFELQLAAAQAIVGRVTDAQSGVPIEGAQLTLPKSRELAAIRSGVDGRYALVLESNGQHAVRCTAEGYASERVDLSLIPDKSWIANPMRPDSRELVTGIPIEIDFALLRTRTLRGRTRDHAGPLAGVSIDALGHVANGIPTATPDRASATSDASGGFELSGLRPDIGHLLTFRHAEHATVLMLVPPAHAPLIELGFVQLGDLCSLEVHVSDSSGARIEGLHVALDTAFRSPPDVEPHDPTDFPRDRSMGGAVVIHDRTSAAQNWYPEMAKLELGLQRNVMTDTAGVARFEDLVSGVHPIVLHGHAPEELRQPVELRPGEQRRIEIVLPAAPPISGRVFDAKGSVAGASVEISPMGWRSTHSDAEGRFSFSGLVDGQTYQIKARWTPPGASAVWTSIVEAKPGAVVELRPK